MKTLMKTLAVATAVVAFAGTAQANHLGSGTFSVSGNGGASVGTPNGGTESNAFLITGTVPTDCSFYTGNAAKTINLGNIGIVANSNVAVNNAFDMAGQATGNATTSTAGCNFKNTVTITKTNGNEGLRNDAAAGYDTNEFQANIPYRVRARFRASDDPNVPGVGTGGVKLNVGPNESTEVADFGAWRSQFELIVNANPPAKALVAGTYTDTVTVVFATI